jgi:spore maturation protein CgeB
MNFSRPRIAIYYWVLASTGYRNDGPPLFANYNLRKILNGKPNMGDDTGNVVHLFPKKDSESFGTFDLHLLVDHGEDGLGVPLDFEYPHPNAYWVSDTHLGYKHRLATAKKFDFVFCCQRRAMEEFERDGVSKSKLFFLPHAYEPDVYKPVSIIEKWDWCFIGHLNSEFRVNILDRFCREIPSYYLGWRNPMAPGFNMLDDANLKFNQARLIISNSIKDDINMRTFEALGSGRCLLTNNIPHLDELFTDGLHLVTYTSIEDGVSKAKNLLENRDLRDHIRLEGLNLVREKHTFEHRMLDLLKNTIGYVPSESREETNVVASV